MKQNMIDKPCDISFTSFMTHRLSENYRNSTYINPINNNSSNSNYMDYFRNSTDSFASIKSNITTTTTTEMSLSNFARNSNQCNPNNFNYKGNK